VGGGLGFAGSSTPDVAAGLVSGVLAHEAHHYDDDYRWAETGPPDNCAKKAWLEAEGEAYALEAEILGCVLDCPDCIALDDAERKELEERKKEAEAAARDNHEASAATPCP
jgi:hypothetical protein